MVPSNKWMLPWNDVLLEKSVLQVLRCATNLFSCIPIRFYFVSRLVLKKGIDCQKVFWLFTCNKEAIWDNFLSLSDINETWSLEPFPCRWEWLYKASLFLKYVHPTCCPQTLVMSKESFKLLLWFSQCKVNSPRLLNSGYQKVVSFSSYSYLLIFCLKSNNRYNIDSLYMNCSCCSVEWAVLK